MFGTINWCASKVVGVFAHMLFGGMKEDFASFAYQAELESLALKLEEENETLMKAKEEQTRTWYKQYLTNTDTVLQARFPKC
ncbi:hypothetical protein Tco_0754810 [Tanacetum coccineum]